MQERIIATLGLAFILGIQHAIEPDHIVAVTSMVAKQKKTLKAIMQGTLWGLGHTTTLFIAGAMVLFLKITIPEKIAMSLEFIVGLVIISLGMHLITKLFSSNKHNHTHTHNGETHTYIHSHSHSNIHDHVHIPFWVGIVHGMAGSAALMLLILSTLQSTVVGLLFILIFGLGSVLGMAVASYIISIPYRLTAVNFVLTNKRMQYFTGLVTILFGVFMLVKIGYIEGLIL